MSYAVKEIFHTLQGEGVQAGSAAVFVRFAGCNLWSGREADRATADCRICDTDFIGGQRYSCEQLVDAVLATWRGNDEPSVVLTGGEPLLQLDVDLAEALRFAGCRIALETNGTIALKVHAIDWITVSPKACTPLLQRRGQELKLLFPQPGLMPDDIDAPHFRHRSLQPIDGPMVRENTSAAIAYCLAHPEWRLSSQQHKVWGIA
jgi:7-carboxy-7-deazaguanine synthase (Cx14CxxC type)